MYFIKKRHFSLVELALGISILAVGLLGVLTLIPTGITKNKASIDNNNVANASQSIQADIMTFAGANGFSSLKTLLPTSYPSGSLLTSDNTDTHLYPNSEIYKSSKQGIYAIKYDSQSNNNFNAQVKIWQTPIYPKIVNGITLYEGGTGGNIPQVTTTTPAQTVTTPGLPFTIGPDSTQPANISNGNLPIMSIGSITLPPNPPINVGGLVSIIAWALLDIFNASIPIQVTSISMSFFDPGLLNFYNAIFGTDYTNTGSIDVNGTTIPLDSSIGTMTMQSDTPFTMTLSPNGFPSFSGTGISLSFSGKSVTVPGTPTTTTIPAGTTTGNATPYPGAIGVNVEMKWPIDNPTDALRNHNNFYFEVYK